MCVALVKIKTTFEIVSYAILLLCLNYNDYVEAQTPNISDSRITRKSCLLKPDPGPCRGNILMHYFDPKKSACNKFRWGGCQGNGNRFDSSDECYSSCLTSVKSLTTSRPRFCNLNFDYGYCFGAVKRYYYDYLWKVCKETIYSGCGGNKNNFYNIEQCSSICIYGKGVLKSSKLKKGQTRKIIIINPPTVLTTKKKNSLLQETH